MKRTIQKKKKMNRKKKLPRSGTWNAMNDEGGENITTRRAKLNESEQTKIKRKQTKRVNRVGTVLRLERDAWYTETKTKPKTKLN